jgi:hypothetical protein
MLRADQGDQTVQDPRHLHLQRPPGRQGAQSGRPLLRPADEETHQGGDSFARCAPRAPRVP